MPISEKTNGDSVNISREDKLVLLVSWKYLQVLIITRDIILFCNKSEMLSIGLL